MDSRFSVDLLPYIWPVVGRSIRRGSRYLYWLEDGVALMVVIYSGAMVARNIDATVPLGVTRVSVSGMSTVRPSESVNGTVGSAGAVCRSDAQPDRLPHTSASASRRANNFLYRMVILQRKQRSGKQSRKASFLLALYQQPDAIAMECFTISNKKRKVSAWSNAQDPAGRQCPAGSCGCAARMQKGDVRKDDEELERTRSASVRTVRCPFQHCHHTIVRTAMQADISTIMNIDTIITKECGD